MPPALHRSCVLAWRRRRPLFRVERLMATAATTVRRPRWWRTRRGQERLVGYGFLLPDVIGLAVFVALPILGAFFISFHDWSGIGAREWTGLRNYDDLIHDSAFLDSLRITATYTVIFVPLLFSIAL